MSDVADRVRRRFFAAALPRGAVWGLAAALACSAPVVLFARLSGCRVPVAWLLAGCAAATVAGLLSVARRVPSRTSCRALADEAARAGGLILVADLPGADRWPRPAAASVPLPPRRLKRPLAALAASCALCGLAAAVPLPSAVAPRAVVPQELMAAAEAEIERLAEDCDLPPEELAEIRAEIRRVAESAPQVGAAETVDALARIADRLRTGDALARDAARRAAGPRTPRLSPDESAALRRSLSETLAASPPSDDLTATGDGTCAACGREGCGDCGDGDREGGPGSGGVSRGPGAAALAVEDPVAQGESRSKDLAREAAPTRDETTRLGEAADEWDPSSAVPVVGPATGLSASRVFGAGAAAHRVLPRHREAVRRYFSTQRNEP